MVLWKIENMETRESFLVCAESEKEMVTELENKGFQIVYGTAALTGEKILGFCAGINVIGHGISAIKTEFLHVSKMNKIDEL